MTTDDGSPEVIDVPAASRFEARFGTDLAGVAVYERRDDRVVFLHTEVDPNFEGRGVGSAVASSALDQVRARGERVVPLCEFMAGYIERHPAYRDLVDRDLWDELRSA